MKPVKEYALEHFDKHSRIVSVKPRAHNRSISLACGAKSHLPSPGQAFPFRSSSLGVEGRYAMELRLRVARTTVDIDLTLPATPNLPLEVAAANVTVREMLQNAASADLLALTLATGLSTPLAHQPWISMRHPTAAHAIPSSAAWTEEFSLGSISMWALAMS
jgi:hypothetical protein